MAEEDGGDDENEEDDDDGDGVFWPLHETYIRLSYHIQHEKKIRIMKIGFRFFFYFPFLSSPLRPLFFCSGSMLLVLVFMRPVSRYARGRENDSNL